jgi:uncharacterized protein (TIGR03066 family)
MPSLCEDDMKTLKLLAVVAIVFLYGTGVRAEEKVDYAKTLVGKWEITKADEGTVPVGTIVEFTKDGKFIVTGKKDSKEENFEGTYTVEKDTFTFVVKIGDMEHKETITITKMTDKEMSTKDKDGKAVECKKKS